jgi:hypothetical protein
LNKIGPEIFSHWITILEIVLRTFFTYETAKKQS